MTPFNTIRSPSCDIYHFIVVFRVTTKYMFGSLTTESYRDLYRLSLTYVLVAVILVVLLQQVVYTLS